MSGTSTPTSPTLAESIALSSLLADQLAVENPTYPITGISTGISKTPLLLATWLSSLITISPKSNPFVSGYCCEDCSGATRVCSGRSEDSWNPIDDEIIRLPCNCLWRRGCLEWSMHPDGDDVDRCPACNFPLWRRRDFEFQEWFDGLEELDIKGLGKEERECDICRREFFNVFESYDERDDEEHCGIAVKLPCNHIFGKECLQLWFSPDDGKGNSCPKCRKELFLPWPSEDDVSDDEDETLSDYGSPYGGDSEDQEENDRRAPPYEYYMLLAERDAIIWEGERQGDQRGESAGERFNWVVRRIQVIETRETLF